MARRADSIQINLQLTPAEKAALDKFAAEMNNERTLIIRQALANYVPQFPREVWEERKKKIKN